MTDEAPRTTSLHRLIERIQTGDNQAQDELIHRVVGRLERLTRKMLYSFPGVPPWEQTGDVLQNALLHLSHTFRKLRPDNTRRSFAYPQGCFSVQRFRPNLVLTTATWHMLVAVLDHRDSAKRASF